MTRIPATIFTTYVQTWGGVSAAIQYPTASVGSMRLCLNLLTQGFLPYAANFTLGMLRHSALPNIYAFVRAMIQNQAVITVVEHKSVGHMRLRQKIELHRA